MLRFQKAVLALNTNCNSTAGSLGEVVGSVSKAVIKFDGGRTTQKRLGASALLVVVDDIIVLATFCPWSVWLP